jgi:hypothetical protein
MAGTCPTRIESIPVGRSLLEEIASPYPHLFLMLAETLLVDETTWVG